MTAPNIELNLPDFYVVQYWNEYRVFSTPEGAVRADKRNRKLFQEEREILEAREGIGAPTPGWWPKFDGVMHHVKLTWETYDGI